MQPQFRIWGFKEHEIADSVQDHLLKMPENRINDKVFGVNPASGAEPDVVTSLVAHNAKKLNWSLVYFPQRCSSQVLKFTKLERKLICCQNETETLNQVKLYLYQPQFKVTREQMIGLITFIFHYFIHVKNTNLDVYFKSSSFWTELIQIKSSSTDPFCFNLHTNIYFSKLYLLKPVTPAHTHTHTVETNRKQILKNKVKE